MFVRTLASTVPLTSLAILSNFAVDRYAVPLTQLSSELVCWIILAIENRYSRPGVSTYFDRGFRAEPIWKSSCKSTLASWAAAACIALLACCKGEADTTKLLPLITPLVLRNDSSVDRNASRESSSNLTRWQSWTISTSGAWAIAIFSAYGIKTWNWTSCFYSAAALLSLYGTVSALDRAYRAEEEWELQKPATSQVVAHRSGTRSQQSLPLQVAFLLAVAVLLQSMIFGLHAISLGMIGLGVLKAYAWYLTMQMFSTCPRSITGAVWSFSVLAAKSPFHYCSSVSIVMQLSGSLLCLNQLVHLLPDIQKSKMILWVFLLIPVFELCLDINSSVTLRTGATKAFTPTMLHPIERLSEIASLDFERMTTNSSRDVEVAITTYRQRYGLEPPPGFRDWYHFAQAHESRVIDEYDTIYQSITPFLRMSGQEVRNAMRDFVHNARVGAWDCLFVGSDKTTSCTHPTQLTNRHHEATFNKLLKNIEAPMEDVHFLVNDLDEPRVRLPKLNGLQHGQVAFRGEENRSGSLSWDVLTEFCPAHPSPTSQGAETHGLSFVSNRSEAIDLCQNPEYHDLHGFFLSPASFYLVDGLVPILSSVKTSTLGDILMPSFAYLEERFAYNNEDDKAWDDKKDQLYWAGSATGGLASRSSSPWQKFHRQRFVEFVQGLQPRVYAYLETFMGRTRRVDRPYIDTKLYDATFTRFPQCDRTTCRGQRRYFRFRGEAEGKEVFESKLAFDTDGNGMSGRFYKLLASKSLPMKQTLFKEWHDDRLVPWVHYVPVSQSMEELPELVSFLLLNDRGKRLARRIAEQGRSWHSQALREVDMIIYLYRLFLELARLQDPNRPALD